MSQAPADCLRTPEDRFENLPDYPFEPHYVELRDGIRMHFIDEGPQEAETILMLHGEPSWSYLYRFMIPLCVAEGYRVVAPDLVGFGKSDKPVKASAFSYASHLRWLREFLDHLKPRPMTLFCQDWGSLLGLRIAAEDDERFSRVVVGNGFLPTGETKVPSVFKVWQAFARYSPWFPIGKIVNKGTKRDLTEAEVRAYDAPFPSRKYKAGARAFPDLVPTTPTMPGAKEAVEAWRRLETWNKPFLTTFSTGDPIMRGGDTVFQARVPGAAGQAHIRVSGGHFLQEDAGAQLAQAVMDLIAATPEASR